jgi:Fic family protein
MGNMLRLEELVQRIRHYVDLRDRGMIPGPSGEKQPLRYETSRMLQEALVNGLSTRGEIIQASGLKERTGRNLLGLLLEEGLLISDSPKGEVKLGFPIHAAGWFFPELYPTLTK